MNNTVGIYLSGTGNTKHCTEKLLSLVAPDAKTIAIESPEAVAAIQNCDHIFFGYPVQFSNAPFMVQDFIKTHSDLWNGKHIVCIATMGAFSGDGAGCTARLFKRYGAIIDGGIHFRMPDSVCDHKALKKSREKNHEIVVAADKKIENVAAQIKKNQYPHDGLGILSHIAGLFGQRLWFYGKTIKYSDELKIDTAKCNHCGTCKTVCPMNNIRLENGAPIAGAKCTMCYRCISLCPNKAITLLGKSVVQQCRYEKYK